MLSNPPFLGEMFIISTKNDINRRKPVLTILKFDFKRRPPRPPPPPPPPTHDFFPGWGMRWGEVLLPPFSDLLPGYTLVSAKFEKRGLKFAKFIKKGSSSPICLLNKPMWEIQFYGHKLKLVMYVMERRPKVHFGRSFKFYNMN